MAIVLGLNAYHGDSSACILREGKLIAAAEEERFRRIKHWAGFPSQSVAYCLQEAGLQLGDVEHVAINRDPAAPILSIATLGVVGDVHEVVPALVERLQARRATSSG